MTTETNPGSRHLLILQVPVSGAEALTQTHAGSAFVWEDKEAGQGTLMALGSVAGWSVLAAQLGADSVGSNPQSVPGSPPHRCQGSLDPMDFQTEEPKRPSRTKLWGKGRLRYKVGWEAQTRKADLRKDKVILRITKTNEERVWEPWTRISLVYPSFLKLQGNTVHLKMSRQALARWLGWSTIPYTKRFWVWSLVRGHTGGNQTMLLSHIYVSLHPSFPSL